MYLSHFLGVLFALASSFLFGGGDFSGGLASRRSDKFQVITLSSLTGAMLLLAFAFIRRESFPSLESALWAALAGTSGAIGLAALYRALSMGNAAIIAPTAGVVGAALPVLFAAFVQGLPSREQSAGFLLAIVGIWLVTMSPSEGHVTLRNGLFLAVLAGLGFSGFFILIAQVEEGALFAPLVVAKLASLGLAISLIMTRRLPLPSITDNLVALLAGALYAGANAFYLLATRFTRLDVAVVLASLYPAVTVFLSRVVLREQISKPQWIGVGLCLAAITLITI